MKTYISLAWMLVPLTISSASHAHIVKMSKSKICHDISSIYYEKTKNYIEY